VYTAADVPVKKVDVEVLKDTKVIPGGQSVGVKLQTTGALVVGHHLINKDKKKEDSPAEEANIQVGDVIVEMNGSNIKQMKDVKPIIKKAGKNNKPIHVKLKRGKEVIDTNINPILDKRNKTYQIGYIFAMQLLELEPFLFMKKIQENMVHLAIQSLMQIQKNHLKLIMEKLSIPPLPP